MLMLISVLNVAEKGTTKVEDGNERESSEESELTDGFCPSARLLVPSPGAKGVEVDEEGESGSEATISFKENMEMERWRVQERKRRRKRRAHQTRFGSSRLPSLPRDPFSCQKLIYLPRKEPSLAGYSKVV